MSGTNRRAQIIFVYILRNRGNKLYIGHTTNIDERLTRHNSGDGARFTRDNTNFKLVYFEEYADLAEAVKREKQLKGWTRIKKEVLIAGDIDLLKKL